MKKTKLVFIAAAVLAACMFAKTGKQSYGPGERVILHAHNAFPDHGKFADRADRVLASGLPVMMEMDLTWAPDGKSQRPQSLLIGGLKHVSPTGGDPVLEGYLMPKLKPIVETALKEGNKGNWPLVTLYLDIKNDPAEHLEAINQMLDRYDSWITSARKPANPSTQAPLDVKPVMLFVYDKNDTKRQFFYDRVPEGGRVRVFGSVQKPPVPAGMSKQEGIEWLSTLKPEQVLTAPADTYRRWFFMEWNFIEKGGQSKAADWTPQEAARLRKFVERAHHLGYFVSSFCLNGFSKEQGEGLESEYNLGSRDAVEQRWHAALNDRMDFIQTDQYEDVARLIHQETRP